MEKDGAISAEKFNRLKRTIPLQDDELSSFVARQLVETSQSVKAIADLFKQFYPNSEVILVKANRVSELRQYFSNDQYDKQQNLLFKSMPEFVKCRDINDTHHAKDAYLNIVVGNVIRETFSANPVQFLRKDTHNCPVKIEYLFRPALEYCTATGSLSSAYPCKGWNFNDSIAVIAKQMRKNSALVTRMTLTRNRELFNLQLEPKGGKSEKKETALLSIKTSNPRLKDTNKYGGYNSCKISFFALIEHQKRKKIIRTLAPIPTIHLDNYKQYLAQQYSNTKILISKIPIYSLIELEKTDSNTQAFKSYLYITVKAGSQLRNINAIQFFLDSKQISYLKNILRASIKLGSLKTYLKKTQRPTKRSD